MDETKNKDEAEDSQFEGCVSCMLVILTSMGITVFTALLIGLFIRIIRWIGW